MDVSPKRSQLITAMVSHHRSLARLPSRWADLTMLVRILERLDKSQHLIDISSNWQVVDRELSQDTFFVDDVCGAQGHALVV